VRARAQANAKVTQLTKELEASRSRASDAFAAAQDSMSAVDSLQVRFPMRRPSACCVPLDEKTLPFARTE
jgi:hypothetical protein